MNGDETEQSNELVRVMAVVDQKKIRGENCSKLSDFIRRKLLPGMRMRVAADFEEVCEKGPMHGTVDDLAVILIQTMDRAEVSYLQSEKERLLKARRC